MGQIRIAVYDTNAAYTERFCRYMEERFGQSFELFPIYEKEELNKLITAREVDAALVPDTLKGEYPSFIGDIHVGFFTERQTKEAGDVFRYQGLRELRAVVDRLLETEDTAVKMIAFVGTNTSVGTSTAAAAYAQQMAAEEKKVLYINMNSLGDMSAIFQGGNPKDLQYLLDELKNGTDMEAAKASVLNRDISGVYFYDNARVPLSMMDIEEEQMETFFKNLIEEGQFRYIIIDSSFSVNHGLLAALKTADKVVAVNDGTYASNQRFHKMWILFEYLEHSGYAGLCQKTMLLYNKFHAQYSRRYENPEVSVLGSIEVLPPAGPVQMVSQMAGLRVLQEILR